MAGFIFLLSAAFIAAAAIPSYFLMCLWFDLFEKHTNKRKGKKDDV